jgi:hypothetical protein
MKTAPNLSLWIVTLALSSAAQSQSIHAAPESALTYGVKATARYDGMARTASSISNTRSDLAPSAFISYSLIPQRLGLHSHVRLGTGWNARGVEVDVQLRSQFAVTDQTQLGLAATTSWLNSSAGHEQMGYITGQTVGQVAGQAVGSMGAYALALPASGLRDVRGGFTLTGPLYERWSYATGASLGRFLGDSRTAALRFGGNGTVGVVFFRADYTF